MKRSILNLAPLLLLFCAGACGPDYAPAPNSGGPPPPPATIDVVVRGLHSHEGALLLALFASQDGFPGNADKALRRMRATIEADTVAFSINDVPAGEYAVSILHDENDNGKMERGMFGRPAEGYGFSRDARGTFGPPGFDDAAFVVSGKAVRLEIEMVYH